MKTEEWQEKAIFIDKLRELTDRLNRCRAAYEAHTPLVSDEIYDILFSDLQTLESWLGLQEVHHRMCMSLLLFCFP